MKMKTLKNYSNLIKNPFLVLYLIWKSFEKQQVQLERLRSENTPLSPHEQISN